MSVVSFREAADELLAITGEIELDGDLLDATRKLRDVCAEYDEVGARFEAAGREVQRLLLGRLSS